MAPTTVTIESTGDQLHLIAPYDPAFPAEAKRIGGRWHAASRTWRFDPRDRDKVEVLAAETWGWTPDDEDVPTVTIRYTIGSWDCDRAELRLAGRRFAWRPGRDSDVQIADGVVLIEGEFPGRGGSVRYPTLGSSAEGVVLEIRDLPVSVARKIVDEKSGAVIIDGADRAREALVAERERLVARLAEIDALLDGDLR